MRVRPATGDDAAQCAAIYAPYVVDSVVSFEEEAPGAEEMQRRIAAAHEWLVAEADGEVVGFAYASEHRTRAAYRWAVDTSVYVAQAHQRRGAGRALYDRLLTLLEERGFHMACAGITLPNPASVALHEAVGFVEVGVYRRIGFKAGAWHDVGWWQRPIGPQRAEPRAPAERRP